MRKKIFFRLLIGVALPPPVGVALFIVVNSLATLLFGEDSFFQGINFSSFWSLALYSYVLIGLQSAVYGFLMEFVGQKIIRKAGYAGPAFYVCFSALLGAVAGLTLRDVKFGVAGGLVGLTMGGILLTINAVTHNPPLNRTRQKRRAPQLKR